MNNLEGDSDDSEMQKEKALNKKMTKRLRDELFSFITRDSIRDKNFCFRQIYPLVASCNDDSFEGGAAATLKRAKSTK